jgi:ferredoxin
MSESKPKPEELAGTINYNPDHHKWLDPDVEFKHGVFNYSGNPHNVEYLKQPNARKWQPTEQDWKLPENWKEIVLEGLRDRLHRFRSLQIFMDICVRCGACADKCHFFIGSGDPKNMPVLRAELLRSVYRNDFTLGGKLLGKIAGARELTIDVIKEWFYYFFQCTQCRRCSVFCPYGIDTAEITILARELLNLIGINIDWIITPVPIVSEQVTIWESSLTDLRIV